MLLTRPPRPVLRAFVKTPWASDQTGETLPAIADRERVLTTGMMHLVARLPTVRGLHPAVAHALERFPKPTLCAMWSRNMDTAIRDLFSSFQERSDSSRKFFAE